MANRLRAALAEQLPSGPAARRLAFLSLIDSVGTGLFLAGSALFFSRVIGLSTAQIGFGLSLAGVAGLLALVPVGVLADRYGARRVLVVLQAWRAGWFAVYPFVPGMALFVLVAAAVGAAERPVGPVTQAVVAAAVEEGDRVRTLAIMRSVRNVGFTLGALLGTGFLAVGTAAAFRTLVLLDAASFVAAAALLARLDLPAAAGPSRRPLPGAGLRSFRDGRYLVLAACNGVLILHTVLLAIAIPLWIGGHTAVPVATVGVLLLVNTVLAVLLQVRLSRGAEEPVGAARRQRQGGLALAGCCLLLALAGSVPAGPAVALAMVAVVALTLGEIWQSAGAWGLSYAYAPADRRSAYLSVYTLGATGTGIAGPLLVTVAVVDRGVPGWLGLAALLAAAGAAVPVLVRHRE